MTTNTENQGSSALDKLKLLLAGAVLLGGVVAYYYFAAQPQIYRLLGVLAGLGIAVLIALQTELGRNGWQFLKGSRAELRKVVWPNRQETAQTTIAVVVMVLALGVVMWLLDMFLLWASKLLTGQGG